MPPKSFKKGNIKKQIVGNMSQSVSQGVAKAHNVLSSLLPPQPKLEPINYNKLEANRLEKRRKRYQKLANNSRRMKNESQQKESSSSVQNSIQRLLRVPTLPRLEPILEPTHLHSQRMNKLKRERIKKAAAKTRANMMRSEQSRSQSLSSLSSLSSNGNNSINGINGNGNGINASQERGLLKNLHLLEAPLVINNAERVRKEKLSTNLNEINRASASRLRKKIAKIQRINKYYNPNNNA